MPVRKSLFHGALLGPALAVAALTPAAAGGFAYTLLHTFDGTLSDGGEPAAAVTLDNAGNIYGNTSVGGVYAQGTIFKFAPDGTETLLHSFGGTGDGAEPDGAVIFDANGNMYGTTSKGGSTNNGTIWELAANGTYTLLHSFVSTEGSVIRGRLAADSQGNLYGTAEQGGANGDGSVFEYSAGGQFTVLHSFDGADGDSPEFGVIMDNSGNLYGVTSSGGASSAGTVYRISSTGAFSSLYSFTGGSDGYSPYCGLTLDGKGNLYGSALGGGSQGEGTVFKLTPQGTLNTIYSFLGGKDGGAPEGDILLVGEDFFSAARDAGPHNDGGIFDVTLAGKEKLFHAFGRRDGYGYTEGLIASGNTLYGTAPLGGSEYDSGVLFSLTKK